MSSELKQISCLSLSLSCPGGKDNCLVCSFIARLIRENNNIYAHAYSRITPPLIHCVHMQMHAEITSLTLL